MTIKNTSAPAPLAISRAALDKAATQSAALAGVVLRYGLVAILLFYGAFKFHPAEAAAIEPMIAHSPFMSWMYRVGDVNAVSRFIGLMEISIALLLALRSLSPKAAAIGSAGAVVMFLSTLSFLFSTPGMWMHVPGFPLPMTSDGGAFLIKDVFLLGSALWSLGEALRAAKRQAMPRHLDFQQDEA